MTLAPPKIRLAQIAVGRRRLIVGMAALAVAPPIVPLAAQAQTDLNDADILGRVEGVRGYAGLIGTDRTRAAEVGSAVHAGDVIQTADGATLAARLVSGTMLFVGPASRVDTASLGSSGSGRLSLLGGIVRAIVPEGSNEAVEIEGRYAIASVRGTEFVVIQEGDQTSVLTLAGAVGVAEPGNAWQVVLMPGDGIDVTAEHVSDPAGAGEAAPAAPPVNRWGAPRVGRVVSMTTLALP